MSARILSQVIAYAQAHPLTDPEYLLLLLLAHHAVPPEERIYPSIARLAAQLRRNPRWVQKLLRRLEKQRLIRIQTGAAPGGGNVYSFTLEQALPWTDRGDGLFTATPGSLEDTPGHLRDTPVAYQATPGLPPGRRKATPPGRMQPSQQVAVPRPPKQERERNALTPEGQQFLASLRSEQPPVPLRLVPPRRAPRLRLDPAKHELRPLCKRGHDYDGAGHSLYDRRSGCVECGREAQERSRARRAQKRGT